MPAAGPVYGCCCLQEWGEAVQRCNDALLINVDEVTAGKALLRRAKANLGRHEFEVRHVASSWHSLQQPCHD